VPFDHFNHRFLDLAKVALRVCEKPDNPVASSVETKEQRFIEIKKIEIFVGQNAGNVFLEVFHHLKYFFIDFTKVAFCHIQNADNEFSGPFHHLKHHFITASKSHFWMTINQKMISHGPPRNIAFSASHKSYFGTARSQILSSQCHSNT
jgi:hypothetical protein